MNDQQIQSLLHHPDPAARGMTRWWWYGCCVEKDEILQAYLNTINLGQGAYGIQMASRTYFGKNVDELTISEAAVLACLPKSPTKMNPVTYTEDNKDRRDTVLSRMKKHGLITEEEYRQCFERQAQR